MNIGRFSVLDFFTASSNVIHRTAPSESGTINVAATDEIIKMDTTIINPTFFIHFYFCPTTKLLRKALIRTAIISSLLHVTIGQTNGKQLYEKPGKGVQQWTMS
jgi:hypothetical protein